MTTPHVLIPTGLWVIIRYVGERPWAGLRPVQIILKKTQGKAILKFPPGTPPGYKVRLTQSTLSSQETNPISLYARYQSLCWSFICTCAPLKHCSVSPQALAESCMALNPRTRPTFANIVEDLATLLHAAEAGKVQPLEAFAIYQSWGDSDGKLSTKSAPLTVG